MVGRILHWSSVVENANNDDDAAENNGNRRLANPEMAPYVTILNESEYTSDTIAQLVLYSSSYVASDAYGSVEVGGPLRGILVLADGDGSSSSDGNANNGNNNLNGYTSPESPTPQGDNTPMSSLSIGSSYEWNVNGNGLTMTDMYGIPTVYVYDAATAEYLREVGTEQSASLQSSSNSNNEDDTTNAVYPSILSEFNYYMGPQVTESGEMVTSKECLEWKNVDGTWSPKCLPLGGNSVWSVAGSPVSLDYSGGEGNNNSKNKPVVMLSTNIDTTSAFHDISPGANTAASNILTLLLSAQLVGSITDEVLDQLPGKIAFGFFQGESYGYLGSRRFLEDVVQGFNCQNGNEGVASVYKRKDEKGIARACLHPLRADLTFQNINNLRGMIAVDQVGNLGGGKTLYVHGGEKSATNAQDGFAGFLAEVMVELSTDDYSVQASSVGEQDGVNPLPPTPLTSLVQVSEGALGGIVLTGYDNAFVDNSLYHSHLDSVSKLQIIDSDAIASAATVLARSAVAAAYQNENEEVDAATAAAYALELLPNAASSSSDTFQSLYNCLFEDGNCETLLTYGNVERNNDAKRTGIDLGLGQPLKTPPNYYVSIYDGDNGQAFVRASEVLYGSLVAEESGENANIKPYGQDAGDVFLLRPSLLEMSIAGLLNAFLGRGSFAPGDDGNTASPNLLKCESTADCSSVSYCSTSSSSLAVPTCAGGMCVCGSRSHYHPALDEAIAPATNKRTSYFTVQDDDGGISALYTEPFWSSSVGVRVYNDAGNIPGVWASSIGSVFAVICLTFVFRLKTKLIKEKVY